MRNLRGKLKSRPEFGRVLSSSAWGIGDKLIRMGVGLVVGALVARKLGPAGFGQIALALAYISLFASLANAGLDSLAVKVLVHAGEDDDRIVGSLFVIRTVAGATTWIVSAFLALVIWHGEPTSSTLIIIYGATLLLGANDIFEQWLQSRQQMPRAVTARFIAFATTAVLRLGLVYIGASVTTFVIALVIEAALAGSLLLAFYKRGGGPPISFVDTMNTARGLLHQSWPLTLSGVAVALYMRVDQVLIGKLLGPASLGTYAAALRFSDIWLFLPATLLAASAPAVARAKKENQVLYRARLVKLVRGMFLLGLGIAVLVSLLSQVLISAMYGARFADAGRLLAILVWSVPPMFLGSASTLWFINEGQTKGLLFRALLGAGASILATILLVPRFGALAAACDAVAIQCLTSFGFSALSSRTRPLLEIFRDALMFWQKPSAYVPV